ncbi:MAG TPA: aspartate-semialdehyde dehydrogenase [Bacteroidia bacterium]|nr:aspartate-semialdehyde dehydrogenase [Bacteroidia bacterium]
MKIALVGATGLVGGVMLKVLEEENFPVTELLPVASERSVGKKVVFKCKEYSIISVDEAIARKPEIALFSAGGSTSLELAPKFAAAGTTVIDNSSAWRMDTSKKLVVPEINGHLLTKEDKIIANPNCSTIQMVMALAPLHKQFTIKRVVVSTYQSVSGTGQKAITQLENERKGIEGPMAYHYPIDRNCIPHCDVFLENGYTKEEMKLVNETRKILGDNSIKVTATTVRVPVLGGHSEAVNLEFVKPFDINQIRTVLEATPGVTVLDDPAANKYPMPLLAGGKNDVFVGRIRRDDSVENGLNLWIVADNLRKGAATNAVQIARLITGL